MRVHLKKQFRFEASHQLPNHDGKCARLHGHSWVLDVWVAGPVSVAEGDPKEGMVMDYAALKHIMEPIIDMLDHHHLGSGVVLGPDVELVVAHFPEVPTSENILIWIADQIMERAPRLDWQCLALQETCTAEARLYAADYALGGGVHYGK